MKQGEEEELLFKEVCGRDDLINRLHMTLMLKGPRISRGNYTVILRKEKRAKGKKEA